MTLPDQRFVVCVSHAGHPASPEVRKLYAVVADSDAEARGMLRVIDESGDDYLYPATLFQPVELSGAARRQLRSDG